MIMQPRPGLLPMRPGFTPRECQLQAVRAFQHHAKLGTKRILTEMVMGSGKGDIVAGLLAKMAWAGKRGLFVVNRDFLIADVYKRTLLVEPALYAGQVKGRLNETDRHVVFASLQTVSNEERARQIGPVSWIFADEAHSLLCDSGRTLLRVMEELNPNVRVAGFTATAYKAKSGNKTTGLGELFGPEVGGTEEPVYSYRIADAIADGVLAPVKGLRMPPLFDRAKVDADDSRTVAEILDTPEHNKAVIEAWLERGGGPGIAFCVDVPHAIHLAETAREFFGVKAEAVWETSTKKDPRTGEPIGTDKDRQKKIAGALAGDIQLLTNMNLLSTGFDWPACEFVLSVAPTGSAVLWPQQVGRGLRSYPGKTCKVLDFCDNSLVHDLGLGADLSTPEIRIRTVDIGDVVRHRRDPVLVEGLVSRVEEEGARGFVEWRGPAPDWYGADELVIIRKRRDREEIVIAPAIVGLQSFPVTLIRGDPSVGWWPYTVNETTRRGKVTTTNARKTWTTTAENGSVRIHVRMDDPTWSVWTIRDRKPEKKRDGFTSDDDAMEWANLRIRETGLVADPPNIEWKYELRTNQQAGYLRGKLSLRRNTDNMTRGEAAQLIHAIESARAVGDFLNPRRGAMREMGKQRYGRRAG